MLKIGCLEIPDEEEHCIVDRERLVTVGYNNWVATALVDSEVSWYALHWMSTLETFDTVLRWHGIIGYAVSIQDALDNIRNVDAIS